MPDFINDPDNDEEKKQPPAIDFSDLAKPAKPAPQIRRGGRVFGIQFDGDPTQWSLDRLSEFERDYQKQFGKPVKYGRKGQGSGVGGWDHTNNADLSADPDTPEGQWAMDWLKQRNIPFRAATVGGLQRNGQGRTISTGKHIHIGPPSGLPGRRSRTQTARPASSLTSPTDKAIDFSDIAKPIAEQLPETKPPLTPTYNPPVTPTETLPVAAPSPSVPLSTAEGKTAGPPASSTLTRPRRVFEERSTVDPVDLATNKPGVTVGQQVEGLDTTATVQNPTVNMDARFEQYQNANQAEQFEEQAITEAQAKAQYNQQLRSARKEYARKKRAFEDIVKTTQAAQQERERIAAGGQVQGTGGLRALESVQSERAQRDAARQMEEARAQYLGIKSKGFQFDTRTPLAKQLEADNTQAVKAITNPAARERAINALNSEDEAKERLTQELRPEALKQVLINRVSGIEGRNYKPEELERIAAERGLTREVDVAQKNIAAAEWGERTRALEVLNSAKPYSVWETAVNIFKDNPLKIAPFAGALVDYANTAQKAEAIKRINAGQGTERDRILMMRADAMASEGRPFLNKLVEGVIELVPYGLEFGISGGTATPVRIGAETAIRSALPRLAASKAGSLLVRGAAEAGPAALARMPYFIPRIMKGYEERVMRGEDPSEAKFYSVLDMYTEIVSESSGGAMSALKKYVPILNRIKTPGFLQKGYQKLQKLGYHGTFNEYMEERVKDALDLVTGTQPADQIVEKLSNPENHLLELATFAVPGVTSAVANAASRRARGAEPGIVPPQGTEPQAGAQDSLQPEAQQLPQPPVVSAGQPVERGDSNAPFELPQNAQPGPVPESPQTIQAQIDSARDPQSPRAAVFYPTTSETPQRLEEFVRVPVEGGTLFVKRTKARGLGFDGIKSIQDYVRENGFEPLIGKVAPVADTSQGPALRTEDAEGNELSTSIVPTPEAVQAQAQVDRAQFPQAAKQEVIDAQAAAQKRIEEQSRPLRPMPQLEIDEESGRVIENGKPTGKMIGADEQLTDYRPEREEFETKIIKRDTPAIEEQGQPVPSVPEGYTRFYRADRAEAEETLLSDAGKRLGYDGYKAWENDDLNKPSTVFIWNTGKIKELSSPPSETRNQVVPPGMDSQRESDGTIKQRGVMPEADYQEYLEQNAPEELKRAQPVEPAEFDIPAKHRAFNRRDIVDYVNDAIKKYGSPEKAVEALERQSDFLIWRRKNGTEADLHRDSEHVGNYTPVIDSLRRRIREAGGSPNDSTSKGSAAADTGRVGAPPAHDVSRAQSSEIETAPAARTGQRRGILIAPKASGASSNGKEAGHEIKTKGETSKGLAKGGAGQATAPSKSDYYIRTGKDLEPVEGKPFKLKGWEELDLFSHQGIGEQSDLVVISEGTTGMMVSSGKTVEEAEAQLLEKLSDTSPKAKRKLGAELIKARKQQGHTPRYTPAAQSQGQEKKAEAAAEPEPTAASTSKAVAPTSQKQAQSAAPVSDGWQQFAPEFGTLGIQRASMPQIKSEHRGAMVQFLKGRGISHEQVEIAPSVLKPSQAEYSPEKVEKAKGFEGPERSILISSDNHVADGHHQWLAALEEAPDKPYPAIRLNAPIKSLLLEMARFPSSGVDESMKVQGEVEIPPQASGEDVEAGIYSDALAFVRRTGNTDPVDIAEELDADVPSVKDALTLMRDEGEFAKLIEEGKIKLPSSMALTDSEGLGELAEEVSETQAREDGKQNLSAIFDEEFDSMFGEEVKAKSLKDVAEGLNDLFGGSPLKMAQAEGFDEQKYAQAKPLFEAGVKALGGDMSDARAAIRTLLGALRNDFNLEPEVIQRMKPYVLKFIEESEQKSVDSGVKQEENNPNERKPQNLEARDQAASNDIRGTSPRRADDAESGVDVGAGQSEGTTPTGRGESTLADPQETDAADREGSGDEGRARKQPSRRSRNTTDGGASSEPASETNFRISDELDRGRFSKKERYRGNVAAIRLVRQLQAENRRATPEEQKTLARYVGWGGIKEAFNEDNKDWAKEYRELKELLTPEEYATANRSMLDAFYTPKPVVEGVWAGLRRLGFTSGKVLEPSVGTGNFIGLVPGEISDAVKVTAVEFDNISGAIAKQLYPKARVHAPTGFEEVRFARDSFDAMVGNPPFGSGKLYDANFREFKDFRIHAFFIAKSLELTRPGGVQGFVMTSRFLDSKGDEARAAREYLRERARILGAIRLPGDVFADGANTQVTTDIVFLQRLEENEPLDTREDNDWDIRSMTDPEGESYQLSKYFARHPQMMLGEMRVTEGAYEKAARLVAREGFNLERDLAEAITQLPENVYKAGVKTSLEMEEEAEERISVTGLKPFNYFIAEGKAYQAMPDLEATKEEKDEGKLPAVRVPFDGRQLERVTGMVEIRDALLDLLKAERSNWSAERVLEAKRQHLNALYDTFTKKYGHLSSQTNKRLFRDDAAGLPALLSLEIDYDKGVSKDTAKKHGTTAREPTARKADIFTKRVAFPDRAVANPETPKDALVASLIEKGRVDVPYASGLLDMAPEEFVKALGDLVYEDPGKGDGAWVTADEYLSGDVKTKLQQAQEAAERSSRYERNVTALREVQPPDVPAHKIFIKLGSTWVPEDVYAKFVEETFEGRLSGKFHEGVGRWINLQVSSTNDALSKSKWGTPSMSAAEIVAAVMTNQPVVVEKYNHAKETYVRDEELTSAAQGKAEELKVEFESWVWKDTERRERLEQLFNQKLNRIRKRKYDGSHLANGLPGIAREINGRKFEFRPHQLNFIFRFIQTGVALGDHVVGAGKTYAAGAAAIEMRRLGQWRKPAIVVPNHLVEQWAGELKRLYPASNILAATRKDFQKKRRHQLFAKIATGDWDAVIIAHSSFGFIPLPAEAETAILEEQKFEMELAIASMKSGKGTGREKSDMERAKERIEQRIKELNDSRRDRDQMDFEQLGIDGIILDEAHEFKNLFFSTTKRGVAAIGDPKGSKKAFDMFAKVRYVLGKNGGRNVMFLTGTPVSNSLAETFHMQRYLQYDLLKSRGVQTFDAWANTFGLDTLDWEMDAAGRFRERLRFSKFANLPELRQLWSTFADTVTRDDLKADAEAQGKRFPLPKIKSGAPINIVVPRSPAVAEYIGIPKPKFNEDGSPRINEETGQQEEEYPVGSIIRRLEDWTENVKDDPREIPIVIGGDARKAGLDFRLIRANAPDDPNSKVNDAIRRIFSIWEREKHRKGTQLVFCDLSTPKKHRGKAKAKLEEAASKAPRFFIKAGDGKIEHVEGTAQTIPGAPGFQFFSRKSGRSFVITETGSGFRISEGMSLAEAKDRAASNIAKLGLESFAEQIKQNAIPQELKDEYLARWVEAQEEAKAEKETETEADDDAEDKPEDTVSVDELLADLGNSDFSVYDDIRTKLIGMGVPEHEVAFIHDFDTDLQKQGLFDKVNAGTVRVLLGSTKKMGAGMNVQQRLVALHHLDAPWKPADLEQREGRIIRQGNLFYEEDPDGFEVEIYRYATEQTYDARMWEINEQKARSIELFKTGDDTVREIEDAAPESASLAEMKAAASGDPRILEAIKLSQEVKKLEAQERSHRGSQYDLQRVIKSVEERTAWPYDQLDRLLKQKEYVEAHPRTDDTPLSFGGKKFKAVEVGKKETSGEVIAAFKAVADAASKTKDAVTVGLYRGFELKAQQIDVKVRDEETDELKDAKVLDIELHHGGRRITYSRYEPGQNFSPSGLMTRLDNMVDGLVDESSIESAKGAVKKVERDANEARKQLGAPFQHADRLAEARKRHQELLLELRAPKKKKAQDDTEATGTPLKMARQGLFDRVGQSVDDYEGTAPAVDWDATDMYGKWSRKSVAEFLGTSPDKYIYQAMVSLSDLNPVRAERSTANETRKGESEVDQFYLDDAERMLEAWTDPDASSFHRSEFDEWRDYLPWNPEDGYDEDDVNTLAREMQARSEEASYDEEEYQLKRSGFPPIIVTRKADGTIVVNDGNHRADIWTDQGYDAAPAWVNDEMLRASAVTPLKMASRAEALREVENAGEIVPLVSSSQDVKLVTVNEEGQEILRRAFEQNAINRGEEDGPEESSFDGTFLDPQQVIDTVQSLRQAIKQMRESGYDEAEYQPMRDLVRALRAAAKEGKGTAVIKVRGGSAAALPHESFHQGSYLGSEGKSLAERHAPERVAERTKFAANQKWREFYTGNPEYANVSDVVADEETAAMCADGSYAKAGITDEEAGEYLSDWFDSYIETNGAVSVEEFERQRDAVKQIIQEAKGSGRYAEGGEEVAPGRADEGLPPAPGQQRQDAGRAGALNDGVRTPPAAEAGARGELKRRSLPETLREQGFIAADELYHVYSDKAAAADAKRLLQQLGFEGALNLLKSGQSLGAEHVQLSKILQRALLREAASVSESDPEQAEELRREQQELATTLAEAMTRGGQFIRGAQVLDSSVEDVMAAAAKIVREKGRNLSEEEARRIHAAGESLETATAEVEVAAEAVADARQQAAEDRRFYADAEEGRLTMGEFLSLQKRLAGLQSKIKSRERKLAEIEGKIPPRERKRAVRARRTGPSRVVVRERAVDLLAIDEAALRTDVAAALGVGPLKMAQPNPVPPSPEGFNEETLEKLAKLGALKLLRAPRGTLSVSDWKSQMVAEFGPVLEPEIDRLHAESVKVMRATLRRARLERAIERIAAREGNEDLERDELEEIAEVEREERRRSRLAATEHDRAERTFVSEAKKALRALGRATMRKEERTVAGSVEVGSKILANAIGRNAKSDIEAIAAAKLSLPNMTSERFAREMAAEHGLNRREAEEAFKAGGRVLEAARKEINNSREMNRALRQQATASQAELDRSLAGLQQARANAGRARRRVASELEALSKSRGEVIISKIWRESKGVPIALMASGDMSSLLRQGGIAVAMQPSVFPEFARAAVSSIRDAGHASVIDRIEQHPDFALKLRMGVDFSSAGKDGGKDEFHENAAVIERVPVLRTLVDKSDKVFSGSLDELRSALADIYIAELRAQNISFKSNPQAYKDLARFINIVTGRADMGHHNTALTKAYLALGRAIGFAPRYRVSRLQFLTLPFNRSFWHSPPASRRIVYKNWGRWFGTMGALFGTLAALGWITGGLVSAAFDPDDDDFLKLKIGKARFDISGGLQVPARAMGRLLREGYRGMRKEVTPSMAAKEMGKTAARFMQSGADPRASLILEWWKQEGYRGEPFTWFGDYWFDGALGSRLAPINISQAIKTFKDEGAGYAALSYGSEFFGVGSQVYPDRPDEPKTKAEYLAKRYLANNEYASKAPMDEVMQRKLDDLKGRSRRGEDVRKEVEQLLVQGVIKEGRAEAIINAKDQTLLQEKFRQLSLEDAEHVYQYASAEEKRSLDPIMKSKRLNKAAKDAKEQEKVTDPARAERNRRRAEKAKETKQRRQELRYGNKLPTYNP